MVTEIFWNWKVEHQNYEAILCFYELFMVCGGGELPLPNLDPVETLDISPNQVAFLDEDSKSS